MSIAKKGREIASLDDWFALAPPKSQDQWKEGRSAMEVADIVSGGTSMPSEINGVSRRVPVRPRFSLGC